VYSAVWTLGIALCLAGRAAAAQPLDADLDDNITAEYAMNGAFVGVGAASLGVGGWALTRDDPFTQGMGYPLVAVGGVQLAVGAVYLALTPGVHRRGRATLRADVARYRAEEGARIDGVVRLFPWFLGADGAAVASGGVALAIGLADGDARLAGVGVGLLAAGALQLALDATALVFARRHQQGVRVQVGVGGLALRW
jgi:hypothetical protein